LVPHTVPVRLGDCQGVNLHLNTMGAGTMLRGMFEDRIQNVIRELKERPNLILFVVDASWSMAAAERMIATKGAIMSLLVDAYQKRDRVGLVVFQKEEARTVLPPTSSVDLAQKALKDVPVGGKTPPCDTSDEPGPGHREQPDASSRACPQERSLS